MTIVQYAAVGEGDVECGFDLELSGLKKVTNADLHPTTLSWLCVGSSTLALLGSGTGLKSFRLSFLSIACSLVAKCDCDIVL